MARKKVIQIYEKTYTPDEIAKMFKISKNTVYELIKRGELHAFKVGNKMRIEESEVTRFKEGSKPSQAPYSGNNAHQSQILHIAGSHDFLIEQLIKYITGQANDISIQPTYVGSLEGLMMLYKGSCDVAAMHLLDPTSKEYNLPFIKQLFVHEKISVIRLAEREQGLITAKGNPKQIFSIKDLARKDIRFVNRQKGAGTRFLLDSLLAENKIDPSDILGYEVEEWNHLSTASYISGGIADVTFGIRSAATKLGLDFIPIEKEKFDLIFKWTSKNEKAIEFLIDILQVTDFRNSINQSEGYDASELGRVMFETKNWRKTK
ncbi:putative molybdopterin biosynthesis protein [Cytobacillus eiseniae]|uniref:Molybdopterin biosynthesis protein n=1 Tax=Cytobacillus eiseniae TaxID=762947 RepID=A0ABS4RBW8_9BACI|nr:helix-turn-helix transcriptional regulator [Cytobacillus eiseniae]MBP2240400.1 putative molybdopterin biosynthesis protein [Cytobacillus eiseniae]